MPTRKKQPSTAAGNVIATFAKTTQTKPKTSQQHQQPQQQQHQQPQQHQHQQPQQHQHQQPQQHQQPKQSTFLATSRLNRGQRKYCHCLMQVRTQTKLKPYGICRNMAFRVMQANRKQPAFQFMPKKTNCIMNYDYSQYTLADIQALALESGIPTYNPKTGKKNQKNTLVQLLTNRYIKKHRQRKVLP